MNNKPNILEFLGKLVIQAFFLGPFAMICFLPWLYFTEGFPQFGGLVLVFLIGSIFCFVLSLIGSVLFYIPGIYLALKKPKPWKQNFTLFLPVFTLCFPIGIGLVFWIAEIKEVVVYGGLISAYLTAVMGWYLVTKLIENKSNNSNHAI